MTLTIELPGDLEARARAQSDDLEADAREAFLVDLYRRGIVTAFELRQLLGLERAELDPVLQAHGVFLDMTSADVADDAARLREVREAVSATRR